MKTLLIWPKFSSFSFWNFEAVCELSGVKYMTPPLGVLTVAALFPREWDLRVVDENVRPLQQEDLQWADLVVISAKIVQRKRAVALVREAKAANKLVVVGGPDPTLSGMLYKDAGADFLCPGEGEAVIPLLLEKLAAKETSGVLRGSALPEMSQSPIPRFDLIDHRDYLYLGIQFSRGCPHNCEFCNVIDLFDHRFRTKEPAQVLAELELLYQLGYRGQVDFFDDNLVGNIPKAKELLRALASWLEARGHPFIFSTSVTLNIAKDEELLALFRTARFKFFLVGIETPDESALKSAQKPQNTGFSISEATDRIYRIAGATVHSGFLLALDDESPDIADQVIRCIDETSIAWVMASVVYPLPGTQLSRRLDREGRLFPTARVFDDENVRDQISAGIQFRPQRPPMTVLKDLIRILDHAYDPERYFARCASVAERLNTIPKLVPSFRLFLRNARTFSRLCWRATTNSRIRSPFWKALWRVVFRNSAGLEAMATLSVLYMHFEKMLPYCYDQLRKQHKEMREEGEEAWLARRLAELPATTTPAPTPLAEPGSAA
jgi:radical SAM superfamily enzyme YgiQ (UPF0313 family)